MTKIFKISLEYLLDTLGTSQLYILIHSISIVYPYSYFFLRFWVGPCGWCRKSCAVPAVPKPPTMMSVCLVLQNLQIGESKGRVKSNVSRNEVSKKDRDEGGEEKEDAEEEEDVG